MLTEVRQRLTQQVHGRRGRSIDPVWANRRLLLRAGNTLSDRARNRLDKVFATDDATGTLQAAWKVKEQLRTLLATGSLADAAAAKDRLQLLVKELVSNIDAVPSLGNCHQCDKLDRFQPLHNAAVSGGTSAG